MTQVCVTYRMRYEENITETCITLPMDDTVATMLFDTQDTCFLLIPGGPLYAVLNELSQLQGYRFAGFCRAEPAEHE